MPYKSTDEQRKYHRDWQRKNKAKVAPRRIFYRYGITEEQYQKLFLEQNGLCAICRKPETQGLAGMPPRLSIDHSHTTDKVRELLCRQCNSALGLFNDSILCLESALAYLKKHSQEDIDGNNR